MKEFDFEIELPEKKAGILSKTLEQEKPLKRSKINISSEKNKLNINIQSKDLTALRAGINPNLRLLDSCLKCLEVIDNQT